MQKNRFFIVCLAVEIVLFQDHLKNNVSITKVNAPGALLTISPAFRIKNQKATFNHKNNFRFSSCIFFALPVLKSIFHVNAQVTNL